MDARERLRQYLEQRREMGERELNLDGLNTEDVLRLIGAPAPRAGAPSTAEPPAGRVEPPRGERVVPSSPAPEWGATSPDWREALRAAGGAPDATASAGGTTPAPAEPRPPAGDDEMAARKRAAPAVPPAAAPDARAADSSAGAPLPGIDAPVGLSVGDASAGLFASAFAKLDSLAAIAESARECTRCPLYASATNAVPGEGNPDADLVCVGEAPGENEDLQGKPFVGASGQLLTKILAAINLGRDDVFIANVLKHRPPGNRNPRPDEVTACSPYLVRQLELIRPKVILCFGTFAAQTLLNTNTPLGKLRGSVHRYYGTPLVVTYHPAALLRNPTWKRPTWEDVQLARRILDRASDA